jgi:hypothetical protein
MACTEVEALSGQLHGVYRRIHVANQQCQIDIVEMSNPKPPKRMRLVDVMTRLGCGVDNRIEACWCA